MEQKPAMLRQIESIPDLLERLLEPLNHEVRSLLAQPAFRPPKKVLLTGCGDSYCAAGVASCLLRDLAGVEAEVHPAINISRHMPTERLASASGATLVIGISASGNVTRVAECMKRVHDRGGLCLAVTGDPASPAAKCASLILPVEIPPFDFAPGVRSYCANLLALTLLAVQIGQENGHLSPSQAALIRGELEALPQMLRSAMPPMLMRAKAQAGEMADIRMFEFVASGREVYTAMFCGAKIIEATGSYASVVNTEDWFHTTYFFRDLAHTSTCLLANHSGTSADRERQLLAESQTMGRYTWTVPCGTGRCKSDGSAALDAISGCLQPLVQYLPVAATASYLCDIRGEEYLRGGKDNWANCANCALIAGGAMTVL